MLFSSLEKEYVCRCDHTLLLKRGRQLCAERESAGCTVPASIARRRRRGRCTLRDALDLKTILLGNEKSKHNYDRSQCLRRGFRDGNVSTREHRNSNFSLRDVPQYSGARGTGLSQPKLLSDELQQEPCLDIKLGVKSYLRFQMTRNLKRRKINSLPPSEINHLPSEETGLGCTGFGGVGEAVPQLSGDARTAKDCWSVDGGLCSSLHKHLLWQVYVPLEKKSEMHP